MPFGPWQAPQTAAFVAPLSTLPALPLSGAAAAGWAAAAAAGSCAELEVPASKAASTIEPTEATFIVFRILIFPLNWIGAPAHLFRTGAKGGELYTTAIVSACPAARIVSLFPNVQFLLSAAQPAQFPADRGAEVAFAGRSNAGKSSAINVIVQRHGLARVSKTPGRTRLLNFFAIGEDSRIVDLARIRVRRGAGSGAPHLGADSSARSASGLHCAGSF